LLSKATAVSIDRQGRIALPKVLLDFAGIGTEILMLGNLGHFELWDPATYEQSLDDESQTFEEIAESIMK
ncbi:MAG: division/cell wall cluster transcriptional repressor MraZ, partial [Candidatus Latescibacteria bacterium]|nr:division/cell wall cluster transcriptional repressor MraZ [Candidatus Latescibacterota bacterium]